MAGAPKDLTTPIPSALPSKRARLLAVFAIVVAGVCGILIGYRFGELMCTGDCTMWRGIGVIVGALMAAGGVAIVAVLTLRAMDEWQTTSDRKRNQMTADRP